MKSSIDNLVLWQCSHCISTYISIVFLFSFSELFFYLYSWLFLWKFVREEQSSPKGEKVLLWNAPFCSSASALISPEPSARYGVCSNAAFYSMQPYSRVCGDPLRPSCLVLCMPFRSAPVWQFSRSTRWWRCRPGTSSHIQYWLIRQ